ncbi:diguanylate cyclase [Marinospirillum sp.]|uniref:GGDEF domain-containing protein n=1 Tax=Marinospirillum sp. TaxID=2183934 RepID=UPI003A89A1B0
MTRPTSSLQQKIARLRASFVGQLPQRLEAAQAQFQQLSLDSEHNRIALVELHRAFHSLKGTGYSFGFNELASVAGEAEDYAQQLLDLPETQPLPQAALVNIEAQIHQLIAQAQILVYTDLRNEHPQQVPFLDLESLPDARTPQGPPLVYLCDDEPEAMRYTAYQLSCLGYRLHSFTEIQAFKAAVLRQPPDAVIMDVQFPQGRTAGTDTLRELAEQIGRPLPAIVLSGQGSFEARLSAVKAGCSSYFLKPARPLEIAVALDLLVEKHRAEPLRILIVDDEPEVANYHALLLEEAGMQVQQISQPQQILETLRHFLPDLVLVDYYMPYCNGEELTAVIRQFPEFMGLPIVYLSSETNRRKQFSAMRAGVEGFITKPVVPDELVQAVVLRAERMRTLRALMAKDSLTGLYNHTTTSEMLEQALVQAKRQQGRLAMVMLDLDHFKKVNDTYGHLAGDQVLVALARVLKHRLRETDIIGRFGGEEFALVLKDVTPSVAEGLVNQLREDFSQLEFSADQTTFKVTFSAGISCYPGNETAESLRITADQYLYEAKKRGRNTVILEAQDDTRR